MPNEKKSAIFVLPKKWAGRLHVSPANTMTRPDTPPSIVCTCGDYAQNNGRDLAYWLQIPRNFGQFGGASPSSQPRTSSSVNLPSSNNNKAA
ncbi:hypothetical protein JTE90_011499 [Oedothorax gibbosus]|uniref:Uncharacterized protein n=1 Tax=Oedothorax gibbosus TaxID=931172 RepID=A0AAV6VBD8_9ARAC|nr:hypothetical protein JTE90_011499 [Oedothorax gibbosus]